MSLHEDMSAAERDFFASRGRNTDALLAENKDGVARIADETPVQSVPAAGDVGSETSEDRRPSIPRVGGQQPPPAQSVESADKQASPAPLDDEQDITEGPLVPTKRVSWPKYQRAMDAQKSAEEALQKLEQERLSWIEERASVNERLRLFNEALKDDAPQQVDEDPAPDPMQDAYAYMQWQTRQLDRLRAEQEQYRQQQGAITYEQQVWNTYQQDANRFKAQYPLFERAANYLVANRDAQYQVLRPQWTPQQRQEAVYKEAFNSISESLNDRQSPAEQIYQLARLAGFDGWYAQQLAQQPSAQNDAARAAMINQSPAPAGGGGAVANGSVGTSPPAAQAAPAPSNPGVPSAVQQVQAIANNQAAARSLSNGGGAPLQNIDSRALATMSQEEFEAIFNQLQNSRNKSHAREQLRELMGY